MRTPESDEISPELQAFLLENQAFFDKTVQPYVEIELVPARNLSLWHSKMGGEPYWPKDLEYPVEDTEQPLKLLAQINLEDVPSLPDFPQQGILQFYIDPADDSWGINTNELDSYERCRVVYFSSIETDGSLLITDFSFIPEFENSPIEGEAEMRFEKKEMNIPWVNFRFNEDMFNLISKLPNPLYDEYSEHCFILRSQIGGYASFINNDCRVNNKELQIYDRLLFQINSEYSSSKWKNKEFKLIWGDAGIAMFLISSEALRQLDFSKVMFTYDE